MATTLNKRTGQLDNVEALIMNTTYAKCELRSEETKRLVTRALSEGEQRGLSPALARELAVARHKLGLLEQRLAATKAA